MIIGNLIVNLIQIQILHCVKKCDTMMMILILINNVMLFNIILKGIILIIALMKIFFVSLISIMININNKIPNNKIKLNNTQK